MLLEVDYLQHLITLVAVHSTLPEEGLQPQPYLPASNYVGKLC